MHKISVIIPIYNVEKYLSVCLESVINQTYQNLEIILVDDGSTDACPKICDDYATKDNRIKLIHKKNGGLSDARNIGVKHATGDLISFVDSDDVLSLYFYEKLINILEENDADIVECGFRKFYNEKELSFVTKNTNK
jgi:glycosyltransferase involved in cell wall biosynthesis